MSDWWGQNYRKYPNYRQLLHPTSIGLILMGCWALASAIATCGDGWLVQWLERKNQTLFFEIRGTVSPPENIIIIAIEDSSLSAAQKYENDSEKQQLFQLMKSWPWQRAIYGEAIQKLMAAGAKNVALDILFDLPSGYGEEDDRKFQQTLQQYPGKITLAAAYLDSTGSAGAIAELFQPNSTLLTPSVSLGLVNFPPLEVDGRVRRLGNIYREQILRPLKLKTLPSFAEATLTSAQLTYPQPQGSDIFFYGREGSFKQIPFWQIIDPDWWDIYVKEGTFKDKIILIGPTAETAAFADLHRTPFTDKMPGVELHANAIATLIEDKSIAQAIPNPLGRGLLVLVVVGASGLWLSNLRTKPAVQLACGLGIAMAWEGLSYLVFTYNHLILPGAVPGIAIALTSLSYLTVGAIRNQLEKIRLRQTLERYVAAPVAAEILKQPDSFHSLLKGKKLKAVILFSDIRGFTTLSYKLPPEKLVAQLNTYFHVIVEVIIEAGGTLDKFIGDAVMAEFGFPISQGEKQDAMNAIRAALGMRKALVKLREEFIKAGEVPFFNGIGINFGEVIAGDIGSLRRSEYGVIGDAVNVASRVEGMTKQFGTDILITDSLYQLVKEEVQVICVGKHPLKGREESLVTLYSLIGWRGEAL